MAHALLRHDADLLRERRAPHRARVHDGRGRRRWPGGGASGATTSCSSPAPTSTGSRSSGRPRRSGVTPQEWADRNERAASATRWDVPRHHQRRLHPHHRAPPHAGGQEFLQRVYDNGDIELDTYEGLYCVGCELYYKEDELDDGNCPIHGTPVEHVTEENYFFRLSRYEDRLLDALHRASRGGAARRASATRCSASSSRACTTSRSAARRSRGASRCRGTRAHVAYVWFDALINYCTAVGYPDDRERFDRYWPADYHLIGKDILR